MGAGCSTLSKDTPKPTAAAYANRPVVKTIFKPVPKQGHTLKKIHGADAKQFPEVFNFYYIDAKHDSLALDFPSEAAAVNFHSKTNRRYKDDKAIVRDGKVIKVNIRCAPQAYKAVINSILTNTDYSECQDFIMAIQNPGDAKDEKQNKRIKAALGIVSLWAQKIYDLRIAGAKDYPAKKANFKLTQADIFSKPNIFKECIEIIKTDPQLCDAWNKLASVNDQLEVGASLGDSLLAFALKHSPG